jgi:hypothetical protein
VLTAGVVLPKRKRRKVPKRPATWRVVTLALLAAVVLGVGVHLASRPPLPPEGDTPLEVVETGAALDNWTDSAGRAALRQRRLDRIAGVCQAPLPRRAAVLDSFPSWPDDVLALVACRRIRPGFTPAQLRAAWGPPAQIIPDLTGMRPVEQWHYGQHSVLIWDGAIRSWK